MLKQHTFLMHNNNNDQLFQLELPMSWNIEKQNLLILFAFCWFFLNAAPIYVLYVQCVVFLSDVPKEKQREFCASLGSEQRAREGIDIFIATKVIFNYDVFL